MAFQVSPGVLVKEIDLTNVVPAVATSIGAIAAGFPKGPVDEIVPIGSEEELVQIFGKPTSDNFETFFTAANFLQYGNALRVVRADTAAVNATADGTGLKIKNDDDYENNYEDGSSPEGGWAARFPGTWGNAVGVSICSNATAFEQNLDSTNQTVGEDSVGATTIAVDDGTAFNVGDLISFSSADASTTATLFTHLSGDEGNEYEVTAID